MNGGIFLELLLEDLAQERSKHKIHISAYEIVIMTDLTMCIILVSISGVAAGYSFCTFFLFVIMCGSFNWSIYSTVIAVHIELSEACYW